MDVGKRSHHLVAIGAASQEVILSRAVAQDEAELRLVLSGLAAQGPVLLTVDQKGTLGHLAVAVARTLGIDTAFLTPHDFHAFSAGYTEVKSDATDAFVIADVSMRLTPRLYPVEEQGEDIERLRILASQRASLVRSGTQDKNRLHSLIAQAHPALESVFGADEMDSPLYLGILQHYGGPSGLRRAGQARLRAFISKMPYYRNRAGCVSERIFEALSAQSLTLAPADTTERVIRALCASVLARKEALSALEEDIAALYASMPASAVLSSMPGVGPVLGPVILGEIGDIARFEDAGHLAAYGGVAPSKRQSGSTLRSAKKKKRCNRALKNAFCESARISVASDRRSAEYYAKKRAEGKEHRAAVLALARRRTDILYAMLKTGSCYEPAAKAL